jgi:hypothetical protein
MNRDSLELKEEFQAEYRARWEAVETVRTQELAAMTEERARQIIRSLRLFAPVPPNPFNGMGLVEQQAIFHRRHTRWTAWRNEDLVIHKVFAGRGRDWDDVETVLIRQHQILDLNQVRSELKPLLELKGELEALDKLARMIATVERRLHAKP